MKFKNYIWDFDGTLFDTYSVMEQALRQAIDEQGAVVPEDLLAKMLQHSIHWVVTEHFSPAQGAAITARFHELELAQQINPPAFPGLRATLAAIQAKGGKNFIATHRDNSVVEILQRADLLPAFNAIITSEDKFPRKPAPTMLLFLLDKFQLDPAKTLMIGDRPLDVLMGQNAGVPSVLFNPRRLSFPVKRDFEITALTDILTIGR
ncbi:HAD-IA family hydrolase [Enterococcus nangangensis]